MREKNFNHIDQIFNKNMEGYLPKLRKDFPYGYKKQTYHQIDKIITIFKKC